MYFELSIEISPFLTIHDRLTIHVLPSRLAQGFFVQRGDVFGFGDFNPNSSKLGTDQDMSKLNKAPIHNLDSERSVGSINYELDRRGATQIDSASSSFLKGKSYDLIELRPPEEYKKYETVSKKVNHLVEEWKEKQVSLELKGMTKKMTDSKAADKRRVKDLKTLKESGGPFTSVDEENAYLENDSITEEEKGK